MPGAVGWTPEFSLNGGALQGSGTCGAYSLGSTVDVNSGFVSGINTIDFFVEGNGQTDGLELSTVSISARTSTGTTIPEPVTLSLFGAGVAGAVVVRRRKKNAA